MPASPAARAIVSELSSAFLDGAPPRDLSWARSIILARLATQPAVSVADDFLADIELGGESDVPRRIVDISLAFGEMAAEGLVVRRFALRNHATGRLCVERFDRVEEIAGVGVVHDADGTAFQSGEGDLVMEYARVDGPPRGGQGR